MITLPIDLELILGRGHVRPLEGSELIYEPDDPYAVVMVTRDEMHGTVQVWTFARDLLTDGLARQLEPRTGGDVRVWRCNPVEVHITLDSPDGRCELHAIADDIDQFLTLTYAAVPLCHEMDGVDMDRELAAIMGGTA
ncbi:SsgA family sporulation/cell division regulator [Streptomyces sp. OK228]|uniref:SsgA family sporulation/cell division regulator n=1 Tax=Streptomyces sp. OK228 TaxID=1882786 RepID=UPI000BDD4FA4|nr:SsgA family sporulation/cell division regulator [Streptomyces sp. OK228]SOE25649.1 Streptomyces sporulation and cell division protein, SsgA [Streptomyces sp. OK228]